MKSVLRQVFIAFTIVGGLNLQKAMAHSDHSEKGKQTLSMPSDLSSRVGGSFALVDHTGTPVTDMRYRGKHLLVFFGYAHCADVCPVLLAKISATLNLLETIAEQIQPLFISVDSERDSPAVLAKYVANFHPRIVGLTGNPEQIQLVSRKYRVAYLKIEHENGAYDYTMDHSAFIYLMGPDGKYVAHFAEDSPRAMAGKIKGLIRTRDGAPSKPASVPSRN